MKILVTGGAGYVGSHTIQLLLQHGHQVVALDNLSTGYQIAVPKGAQFLMGDVRDSQHLSYILEKEKIQAVIHLAAKVAVSDSLSNPLDYYDVNTCGTLSVLKACKQNKVNKIVFSSSATVYGSKDGGQFTESCPLKPINPYGHSKAMAEQILIDHELAYGIKSVRFRYFNVAGAALNSLNGQRTLNCTHLIKTAAEVAAGKRQFINVYGSNYRTPDGTSIRDYIHVVDLADLHIRALNYLDSSSQGTTLNCGYGKGTSVKQVIEVMKKVSGVNLSVKFADRRPGDAICLVANTDLLKRTLNWSPQYDDLEVICKTSFEWEKTSSFL